MTLGPDHLKTLAELQSAGFEMVPYERFSNYLGVSKGNFVALLAPETVGWRIFGEAGYRFPEGIGVLVRDTEGKKFIFHGKVVRADAQTLADFRDFRRELEQILGVSDPQKSNRGSSLFP